MELSRQANGGSIECAAGGQQMMNSATFEFGTMPGKDSVGKDCDGKFSALKPGRPEGGDGASPSMQSAPTVNEAKTDSLDS